ncbi:Uncharacterized protein SCF082_LOCUS14283, partial [Durusdinium trenchii]
NVAKMVEVRDSASFIGSVTLISVMLCMIGVFVLLRKNREIRVRGVKETAEVGFFVTGLASFGVLGLADDPFMSCNAYVAWGLIPIIFVWVAFALYILRYWRLYRINSLPSRASVGSSASAASAAEAELQIKCCGGLIERAKRFSISICDRPGITAKLRLWNLVFVVLAVVFFALYVNDNSLGAALPISFSDCASASHWFYAAFSIMMLAGGFYLMVLFGVILDVAEHASRRGDALGIRPMLYRMGLDAFLSMVAFVICISLWLGGLIEVRWIFGCFLPFIMSFLVDLVIIPIFRSVREKRKQKELIRQNGLVGEHLSRVFVGLEVSAGEAASLKSLLALQSFLLTENGYHTFRLHLANEFGLESLLFLIEALAFANEFSALADADAERAQAASELSRANGKPRTSETVAKLYRKQKQLISQNGLRSMASLPGGSVSTTGAEAVTVDRMNQRCREIFDKYICKNAEFQVNLPANVLGKFRGIHRATPRPAEQQAVSGGIHSLRHHETHSTSESTSKAVFEATPTVFNIAVLEVLNLLFNDSFQRYLANPSNAKLWSSFQSREAALEALDEDSKNEIIAEHATLTIV